MATIWSAGLPHAQAQQPAEKPSVMVIGSVHLLQRADTERPINVAAVQQGLRKFGADHVVIEWLHPSIDPSTTFNYRPLGDRSTLARLWGYSLARVPATIDSLRAQLANSNTLSIIRPARGALRQELARLLYLAGDETNAAYQWYRARRDGSPDPDGERLVVRLLSGHEGVVWGFETAISAGLEWITAFDYQGNDAGTYVWGEMLGALRDSAIAYAGNANRSDSLAFKLESRKFDSLRTLFEAGNGTEWLRTYGRHEGVQQYAAFVRGAAETTRKEPAERDGLTVMRFLQSPEYETIERFRQQKLVRDMTFGGYGEKRYAGIMARNRHMAEFLLQDHVMHQTRRILVVVGAAHKFALEEILRARGFHIIDSRKFIPDE